MKTKHALEKPGVATSNEDEESKPVRVESQRQSSSSPQGENLAAKMPNLFNFFHAQQNLQTGSQQLTNESISKLQEDSESNGDRLLLQTLRQRIQETIKNRSRIQLSTLPAVELQH